MDSIAVRYAKKFQIAAHPTLGTMQSYFRLVDRLTDLADDDRIDESQLWADEKTIWTFVDGSHIVAHSGHIDVD